MSHRFRDRPGHYLLLLAVASALCLANLGGPSLWDIDEGHNAEAAREMLVSGNWVVPTFNFRLRSDKPALLYWLQIGAYRLFGVNEFAARLPSALAGVAAVLLTYELGRRMFGPATGLLAGLVLASSVLFCAAAHFANPDALLLAFTTLTLFFFWDGFARGGTGWFAPAGASAGLAVLAKGPVGLALPLAVTVCFLVRSREVRRLLDRRLAWGVLAFAAVAVPWYAWVSAETRLAFLREFLLTHNTGRYGATMEGHGGPVYYYLVCLALGFAPWSAFLVPVCLTSWGRAARKDEASLASLAYRFLWCWVLTYLIFFSASATKLPNYVLPVYPPLAILTARFLDRWRQETVAVPGWLVRGSLACLVLVGVGVSVGLALAGGAIDAPFLRGRKLPGLEGWAPLGLVPIAGAAVAWWCVRRQYRTGLVAGFAASAVLFLGAIAWAAGAVDRHKAAKPLVASFQSEVGKEVRVGCYGYYQPSLVFYSRREVARFADEGEALEFLRYPILVYLFLPADAWETLSGKVPGACRVVARHQDLYLGREVVVVANRPATDLR